MLLNMFIHNEINLSSHHLIARLLNRLHIQPTHRFAYDVIHNRCIAIHTFSSSSCLPDPVKAFGIEWYLIQKYSKPFAVFCVSPISLSCVILFCHINKVLFLPCASSSLLRVPHSQVVNKETHTPW